jgi:dTDP-glucose 4,6-dehydratase/UDP-glucose 4-epimerase
MSYLVIGSEGFIGGALVNYLASLGRVVERADIQPRTQPGYTQLDPCAPDFDSLLASHEGHVIINCAGAASVPDSLADPLRDFALNTHCVLQMLEAMRKHAPKARFINLSSAAVYGNPGSLPIAVSAPIAPVSPYGFHKRMSELACDEYHSVFGLQTVSLRIFSAYGEGLRKQLFWDLHRKTQAPQRPIELFGTGEESRDFIYIQDLVRAIVVVAEHHAMNGRAINVASGRETRITDAVECFLGLYDPRADYHFSAQARAGDPLNWCADISDLETLGYSPQWTMAEGLAAYHQWLLETGA